MFSPFTSTRDTSGSRELSAVLSSNFRVTLVVSLVVGVNCERTRTPKPMGSSVGPIGADTGSTNTLAQESLPVVTGKVHVGTGVGAAALALPAKAKKPTPRAAAEHRRNVIRLLVRI